MDLEFKAASTDDIASLLEWNKALIDRYEDIESIDYEKVLAWCERKIRKCLAEYSCIWYRGEKAGYIRSHLDGDRMELDDLYIFPEYQSRGIGTAVLQHYIHASDRPIYLYVFSKNVRAITLYERLGFRVIETVSPTRFIMQRDS